MCCYCCSIDSDDFICFAIDAKMIVWLHLRVFIVCHRITNVSPRRHLMIIFEC